MDIPGRRTKTVPSKLIMELVLYICLVHDDANSVMLDHLREYAPISPRTAYRYIHDLEAVQNRYHFLYHKDPDQERFVSEEIENTSAPPISRHKLIKRKRHGITEFPFEDILPREYWDLDRILEDQHLIHLHRLILIDKHFKSISEYYDVIRYDLEDLLFPRMESKDSLSNRLGLDPEIPLSQQAEPDLSLKSSKLRYHVLKRAIQDIEEATKRSEDGPGPFPVGAPEVRKYFLEDLELSGEELSLRTVQRYLKELKEAYIIFARIYRKSTYF